MHPLLAFLLPHIHNLLSRLLSILLPLTVTATGILTLTILALVTLKLLHAIYIYFNPPPPPRIPDDLLRFPSAFNPPIPPIVNDNLPKGYWDTYLVRKAAAKRPGKVTTLEGLYEEVQIKSEMNMDGNDQKKNNKESKKQKADKKEVEKEEEVKKYEDGRDTLLQPVDEWEKQQKRMRMMKKFGVAGEGTTYA